MLGPRPELLHLNTAKTVLAMRAPHYGPRGGGGLVRRRTHQRRLRYPSTAVSRTTRFGWSPQVPQPLALPLEGWPAYGVGSNVDIDQLARSQTGDKEPAGSDRVRRSRTAPGRPSTRSQIPAAAAADPSSTRPSMQPAAQSPPAPPPPLTCAIPRHDLSQKQPPRQPRARLGTPPVSAKTD